LDHGLEDALNESETQELMRGLEELRTLERRLAAKAARLRGAGEADEEQMERISRLRRDVAITLAMAHITDGVGQTR
jgi:hypothetical protein